MSDLQPDPDADYEAYERWCIRHEADPWPTPEFPFGANAPALAADPMPDPDPDALDDDRQLLAVVRDHGVEVNRRGDQLLLHPVSRLPAEVLTRVCQRKAHLLALLAQPDAPDRPAQTPARPSAQAPADWRATLDRLTRDALAIQRAVLAEGERHRFPPVTLGASRSLVGGRLAWEAFVRSNYPAPHRDGLDLADWLATHPAWADDDLLA